MTSVMYVQNDRSKRGRFASSVFVNVWIKIEKWLITNFHRYWPSVLSLEKGRRRNFEKGIERESIFKSYPSSSAKFDRFNFRYETIKKTWIKKKKMDIIPKFVIIALSSGYLVNNISLSKFRYRGKKYNALHKELSFVFFISSYFDSKNSTRIETGEME